jgi:hypothetical protein
MASVVTALKSNHGRHPVGQQVNDLTLPFVAPLVADNNYIPTHALRPLFGGRSALRSSLLLR